MKPIFAAAALFVAVPAFAEEARPLKLEAVDQVIEQNDRLVQTCGRKLRGDTLAVLVHLEIDADGRVTTADPAAKPTNESQCLQKVAKRFKFPATGTVSKLDYPFMLAPQLRR
jgi:hypothetical protein